MDIDNATSFLTPSPTPSCSHPSMEQLRALKAIYDAAFITRKEYEERKKQLIDKLTNTTTGFDINALGSSLLPLRLDDSGTLVEDPLIPFDVGEHLGDKLPFDIPPPPSQIMSSQMFGILSKEEKHDLAATISRLDPEHLDKIIQLIDLMAPHLLKFNPQGNEYSFDLNEFDDKMLSMVNEYVQTIQNTRDLPKDGQCPDPQSLHSESQQTNNKRKAAINIPHLEEQEPRTTKRTTRKKVMTDFYTGTPETSANEEENSPSSVPENKFDVVESSSEDESEDEDYKDVGPSEYVSRPRASKQSNRTPGYHQLGQGPLSNPKAELPLDPNTKIPVKIVIHEIRKSEECPEERPWKCDVPNCRKCFSDSSNLLKHIRTHTKEKPYGCPYKDCDKSYAHSASLKEHLNTHTGEKPFICTYTGCTARFAQNSNLRRHTRIHTNEKPYVCSECKKAFTQSSNLKQHLTIHYRKRNEGKRSEG